MAAEKIGPLCFSCHPDLGKTMETGRSKHAAAGKTDCTQCHNPHNSKLDNLLLARSPDLCLNCHKELKAQMGKEKVHSPASRDCLRCHQPHASAETALLSQKIQPLCGQCHDLKKDSFGKAHLEIDPSVIECRNCHDPHASKDPKFFKATNHPPFIGGSCEDCHMIEKR
jgi:predicted CXXCH cytochrome family protein